MRDGNLNVPLIWIKKLQKLHFLAPRIELEE